MRRPYHCAGVGPAVTGFALGVAALTAGCVLVADDSREQATVEPPHNAVEIRPRDTVPTLATRASVTIDGRKWWVRELTAFAPEIDRGPRKHSPAVPAYETLSDAEVADRVRGLRMAVGSDGKVFEYEEAEPDYARVAAARAKDRAGLRMAVHTTATGGFALKEASPTGPPPAGSFAWDALGVTGRETTNVGPRLPVFLDRAHASSVTVTPVERADGPNYTRTVFGTDERAWLTHSDVATYWQYSSNLWIGEPSWGVGGSGTLIGRSTAISAAHVFWDAVPGGTWYSTRSWAAGVVRTRNNVTGAESTTVKFGSYDGCYWVTIPFAFTTSLNDEDDYAVIDYYPCNLTPGTTAGWHNAAILSSSEHIASNAWLHAYDQSLPLPQQPATFTYRKPSLITRAKGAWSVAPLSGNPSILSTTLDITAGVSGGSILQTPWDNYDYAVGVMVSEDSNGNYARRMDWTYWSFIAANSGEY